MVPLRLQTIAACKILKLEALIQSHKDLPHRHKVLGATKADLRHRPTP